MADEDDITRDTPVDNTVKGASDDARIAGAAVGGAGTDEARMQESGSDTKGQRPGLQDIHTQLVKQVDELHLANGAVNVCVQALLQQNADLDADIARVLQRVVGDKLFETAERLELVALAIEYAEELTPDLEGVQTAC